MAHERNVTLVFILDEMHIAKDALIFKWTRQIPLLPFIWPTDFQFFRHGSNQLYNHRVCNVSSMR